MAKQLYSSIIFYDYTPQDVQLENLYKFALDFFEQYNQKPIRMGLHGEGVKESSKTKTFKHYHKVIQQLNFQSITDVWMGGQYPEEHDYDQNDCYIGVNLGFKNLKTLCFYFDKSVVPYDTNLFKTLAQTLEEFSQAKYGFVRQIPKHEFPYDYAPAILNGDEPEEEKNSLLSWDRAYNDCESYKTGDLRDIYALNFIGEAHLTRTVFGQSLKQWIQSDPLHGTLNPLTKTLWVWEVDPENIPLLRQALKPTNLLVCFRPYR